MKTFHRLPLVLLLAVATAAGFLINALHAATQDEQVLLEVPGTKLNAQW
jgi:hypothetical protein